jgi:hypothetical protein
VTPSSRQFLCEEGREPTASNAVLAAGRGRGMSFSAWMSGRAAHTAPQWPRRADFREDSGSGGRVPKYGAYGAAAARFACAAIASGRHGGGQTRDFNSTRKKRPASRPPRWGSRAAAGLHSPPSAPSAVIYVCTDGPAVPPWKGGRPDATPQYRRASWLMGGWPDERPAGRAAGATASA